MKIEILSYPHADTDYGIGYVDGDPAVIIFENDEDVMGYYFIMNDGEYVENLYEGFRWFLDENEKWVSSHVSYPVPEGFSLMLFATEREFIYRDDASTIIM